MTGFETERRRMCVAILALGGQGGGVLADWIATTAEQNGYWVQATSVPGVAQRTGSTVYYIELVPIKDSARGAPIMALMPAPGDVDLVIALELMEAGRAILRGFVSDSRTTLIASTHRIYAISEKGALDDRRAASDRIIAAARQRSRRFIGFDMEVASIAAGSAINATMLGALAASGALPFPAEAYEEAIRSGGKSVGANLRGFQTGLAGAAPTTAASAEASASATTPAGRAIEKRIKESLPELVWPVATHGARRLMDYQDKAYAAMFLDRLSLLAAVEPFADHRLTIETGRLLALWMSYEDVIRVASLKLRAQRLDGIRSEARAAPGQLVFVTEYMHPGIQELCDILPAPLGARLRASPRLSRWLAPLLKARHVEVTKLRWFALLAAVASLRPLRRRSLRFQAEQAAIEAWLQLLLAAAPVDPAIALEAAAAREIVKGYGDTMERTRAQFDEIMTQCRQRLGRERTHEAIAALRLAAVADDTGEAFRRQLASLG